MSVVANRPPESLELQSQLLPETDPQFLQPFAVTGTIAVNALVRELISKRALITLYSASDYDEFVVSRIARHGEDSVDFDFVTDDARRRSFEAAGGIVVVALLDTIKVQFELAQPRFIDVAGTPTARGALPPTMYRIQRREAFRVRPAASEAVALVVRGREPGTEHGYRVIDFSVSGIAYAVPAGTHLPTEGDRHLFSRIEMGENAPVPCTLVVRHVSAGLRSENGAHRIGCAFTHLDPDAARRLQVAVIEMERRQRAAGAVKRPAG